MPRSFYYQSDPEKYKAYNRQYYATHREARRAYAAEHVIEHRINAKRWIKMNPAKHSLSTITSRRKKNGFSKQQFNSQFTIQNGLCAICDTVLTTGLNMNAACADHAHSGGGPRGILCKRCNLMLEHTKDNVLILQKAIDYLTTWKRTV